MPSFMGGDYLNIGVGGVQRRDDERGHAVDALSLRVFGVSIAHPQ